MDHLSNGAKQNVHSDHRSKVAVDRAPLAIVGMGCRFPGGVNGPEAFWRLLSDGVDAITDIPADRWNIDSFFDPEPNHPGKTNSRWGGFIEGIDQFDPHFFGISPREAERMDPQQRLLLEVAFEALEDGGQTLERLAGQDVAVWMGLSSWDYNTIQHDYRDRTFIDVHSNTGGTLSIAANRISYCFNFKGPSAVVDTACSSALLAVHLACQSLWTGESSLALAGGANVLLDPGGYIGFTKLSMMSADGRCKAFDARANGFVRSEGCGVVVLKPLAQALLDRDRIYALIRATATNQDGRTRSMTVPSQDAQERLLREACKGAEIEPTAIQYVEAHGTGTPVGDPIEARALGSALGKGRRADRPLLIGSVKTNIGHLESASGIAGLIKAASCVSHRQIPANLHFQTPNPEIPFETLGLRVPTRLEPWPECDGPAMAGINSFGFGGLNAMVILQEAPKRVARPEQAPHDSVCVVPLSARSPAALMSLAVSYKDHLNREAGAEPVSLRDLAYTTSLRRTHHQHRLAVIAHSITDFVTKLSLFTTAEPSNRVVTGHALSDHSPSVSFVFCGQGAQWWGMGRQLLSQEPVFAGMIKRCDEILERELGWSLLKELTADETDSRMEETAIAQPAIFGVQVALAELWNSWGIWPASVVGHSVGEVAAAYTAGALSLEDAVKVIGHRGRCMELAPAKGGMLAVGMSSEEAQELLAPYAEVVSVAAINSPSSLTLSGPADVLKTIAADLELRGLFGRMLHVNYAFHSPGLEPVRDELLRSLADLKPRAALLPIHSTVTGNALSGTELDAEYWWRNLRQAVHFADAIKSLAEEQKPDVFLEVGPHPVLAGPMSECFASQGFRATIIPSLRRGEEERPTLLRGLGELYTLGYPVAWSHLVGDGNPISLPNYPWQHQRYWRESDEMRQMRIGIVDHPLLGHRMNAPQPTWEGKLELRRLPWLEDHQVRGQVIVAGMAYVEMAFAAARLVQPAADVLALSDVKFVKACLVSDGQAPTVRTILEPETGLFQVYSRNLGGDGGWSMHARGVIRPRMEKRPTMSESRDEIRRRCPIEITQDDCYSQIREAGLDFGPTFRGVSRLWRGQDECLAKIEIPAAIVGDKSAGPLHPAAMDACFHFLGTMGFRQLHSANHNDSGAFLFIEIGELQAYSWTGQPLWSRVWLTERGRDQIVVDCQVFEETGAIVWEARGIRCQAIGFGDRDSEKARDELVYQSRWQVQPLQDRRLARSDGADLAGVERLSRKVLKTAGELRAEGNLEIRHEAFQADADLLCLHYALAALEQLGADLRLGRRFTLAELAAELHIVPQKQRVLKRCLGWLVDARIIATSGEEWQVLRPLPPAETRELWRNLFLSHPGFFADFNLLRKCGQSLAQVLRGDVDPLELIFPGGSLSDAEQLYQHGVVWRFHNLVVQDAVRALVDQLPRGRSLRILEIGGGTGGTTAYLAPCLPADRAEYVFTDLSAHFLGHVQHKLRDYPFVRYERMDIEQDPLIQGFESESFDVIVASQVLHATADVRQALRHVRQLLAPSGWLFAAELVRPQRLLDLIFGLLEGWWHFTDSPLRTDHPLLTWNQWQTVLAESGFESSVDLSGSEEALGNAVIAARSGAAVATKPTDEPPVPLTEHPGFWLLLADRGGFGERLAAMLEARGDRCILVQTGDQFQQLSADRFEIAPFERAELARLFKELGLDWTACRSIVHLWSLDAPGGESLTPELILDFQGPIAFSTANLVQLLGGEGVDSPRLVLVTRQAQAVDSLEKTVSPLAATLWGLGRVINNEAPDLRCRLIDLGGDDQEADARSLAEELWEETPEDEVAFRGPARFVHRFVRTGSDRAEIGAVLAGPIARAQSFRLEASSSGTLESLELRSVDRRAPAAGEVEIEVHAAGLNFSDVMKALALYPGLPDGPVPLGLECAGVVIAVGPDVQEFRIGERVMGFANFSFSKHLCVSTEGVFPVPDDLTFEEAATFPVAFLTAAYALHHLGRLQPRERVLIHSATGGVGLAALQLARLAGAEVFATAGSPEKRDLLRALGVLHVMDSRSVAFAAEVLKHTGGHGVDIVLNSLSGEAIPKGISVLAEHGRFIEIGKRDIYQNRNLGMALFRKNVSLLVLDAMRLTGRETGGQIRSMVDLLRQGKVAPLPHQVFPLSDVRGAFQCMAHARHIGKVVVSFQGPAGRVAPGSEQPPVARADATYLVTGGLGGFGLATARWLVAEGARHLALMGRCGASSHDALEAVYELQQAGAEVVVIAADVSQPDDVDRALQIIASSMPPLRGVIHGAMVLDDGLLVNLTPERWQRVLAPKAVGAWNLHQATRHLPLDFFVSYSSMSTIFGVAGQSNYCAANAFLDALAHYRRTLGLPGLSINWGYIGDVGYVSKNEKIRERFESWGVRGVGPRQALALLARFLHDNVRQAGIMNVDWERWRPPGNSSLVPPRFQDLCALARDRQDHGQSDGISLRTRLEQAAESARKPLLQAVVGDKVAKILGTTPAKMDVNRSITDMGLDSLVGMELRNWIESEVQVSISIIGLTQGLSVVQLTDLLLEKIFPETAASDTPSVSAESNEYVITPSLPSEPTAGKHAIVAEQLGGLTENEVDIMLTKMLTE